MTEKRDCRLAAQWWWKGNSEWASDYYPWYFKSPHFWVETVCELI